MIDDCRVARSVVFARLWFVARVMDDVFAVMRRYGAVTSGCCDDAECAGDADTAGQAALVGAAGVTCCATGMALDDGVLGQD